MDELMPGFSERSQRGRRNRAKGAEFERDVAIALKTVWKNAKRAFGQSRDGDEVPDVTGTPFWIECTKGSASIYTKLAQGLSASKTSPHKSYKGSPVIVVSSKNGSSKHVVSMQLDDFLDIIVHVITVAENFT